MTRFDYKVDIREQGAYTTVTRLSDGSTKTFFNAAHKSPENLIWFMNSITDELAESYFPKLRSK